MDQQKLETGITEDNNRAKFVPTEDEKDYPMPRTIAHIQGVLQPNFGLDDHDFLVEEPDGNYAHRVALDDLNGQMTKHIGKTVIITVRLIK